MIGDNIYNIRKEKRLSLSELAKQAKVSKSNLSNIERNLNTNPSITLIRKIADVLDVDLFLLLKSEPKIGEKQIPEDEWIQFVNDLKESGVEKGQLQEYKRLIEFINWQNEQNRKNSKD
ncbi:helix-turn-helix domain-containing protein [Halobacillus seohaensis]|uniref:Helix-turn-helix domain-containing protein n=1 Tax=Halobacillus seohaensis TaxID=447421 RepID=A0ABW2EJP8_9BACI